MTVDTEAPVFETEAPAEIRGADSNTKVNSLDLPGDQLHVVEDVGTTFWRFVDQVKSTETLLVNGKFPRAAAAAAAELVKRGTLRPDVYPNRLQKAGAAPGEVDAFVKAVESIRSGRALTLLPARDQRTDPRFLVDGVIVEGSLALLLASPKVGKTFVALSMAVAVAQGIAWLDDRPVRQGLVVYVSAEGIGGVPKRLRALQEKHGLEELPPDLMFIDRAIDLLDAMAIKEVIALVEEMGVDPVLVVFDTYARSMPGGDENSAKDAGLAVQALDKLRFDLGTAVLVVHHTPKSGGKTARGSGALEGAADTVLFLERVGNDLALKTTMMKDFEPGEPIGLGLEPLGDSAVAVERAFDAHGAAGPGSGRGVDAEQQMELQIFDELRRATDEWRTPISQTDLLRGVKGNAEKKADVLRRLAASDDYPVSMKEVRNKKVYELVD